MPAVLAPLVIRKPGAALFAEMVAAGVSALLGSQWGVDTLLSGFVQGAAAELVFAFTLYRRLVVPRSLAIAARRERGWPRGSTTGSSTTPTISTRHPGRSRSLRWRVSAVGHRGGWLARCCTARCARTGVLDGFPA